MSTSVNAADADAPGWGYRLLWLALAGAGFFLLYGSANRYAAGLPSTAVGNIAFDWEHAWIPFWPWTIVPYWSIDLLFAVSIFIGHSRREVRIQALRLMLITLIASVCFVIWPLRFGWNRPALDGVFGAMFAALGLIDKPFNQAPSLHIALLYAIWRQLLTHSHSRWHVPIYLWCALIGLSVLTTWQHHLLDVPTGLALGVLVCYALPMPAHAWPSWQSGAPLISRKLAGGYAIGAVIFMLMAVFGRGWAWLALWPAVALGTVALGYLRLGPAIFQKSSTGRTTLASGWLLWPYRLGARVSWHVYRRRLPPPSRITAEVLLTSRPVGPLPDDVQGVLDLCPEFSRGRVTRRLAYGSVPMLDLVPPDVAALSQAVDTLERLRRHGPVAVHCALGLSRSAMVVAAWLIAQRIEPDIEHALARLRRHRPQVVLHDGHHRALCAWSAACR